MSLTPEQTEECAAVKKLFAERAGMSQRAFAERFDLGTPGNLWQYLNGRRALNLDVAVKIASGLGVRVADFSPRLAAKQSSLTTENVTSAPRSSRKVPLLTRVQAGRLRSCGQIQGFESAIENGDFIAVDDSAPDGCFALKIEGRSMEPDFIDGDVILIDPNATPHPGDFVVGERVCPYTGEFETTFKKFRVKGLDEQGREIFELVPLNPDFPILSSKTEHIDIAGVMIEHRRSYARR